MKNILKQRFRNQPQLQQFIVVKLKQMVSHLILCSILDVSTAQVTPENFSVETEPKDILHAFLCIRLTCLLVVYHVGGCPHHTVLADSHGHPVQGSPYFSQLKVLKVIVFVIKIASLFLQICLE